jgi:hypothetical protein
VTVSLAHKLMLRTTDAGDGKTLVEVYEIVGGQERLHDMHLIDQDGMPSSDCALCSREINPGENCWGIAGKLYCEECGDRLAK